jgi:B12-binding domain/radical SAM domain protein of rhizo-twelve system
MRFALVNPPWSFESSVYFGCREPHLPLEFGYARALLQAEGHEAFLVDAQLARRDLAWTRAEVERLHPDAIVVTTAPSYLFWRCAPPELRVPMETTRALAGLSEFVVGIGPHASTTPRATLRKLRADVVVLGECEEVLCALARTPRARWHQISSIAYADRGEVRVQGTPATVDMRRLPALAWEADLVRAHTHHHHRFDRQPDAPGAELEASRGCPYRCTFCAKENFRDAYRKRPLEIVLADLDGLRESGVRYVYFVDEIFIPDRALLEALATRDIAFGVQMRIDNWSKEMLDLLGRAGCVSIEAGVESITPKGRSLLAKKCKKSTDELAELLVHAKKSVAFVQANLIGVGDDPALVENFRAYLRDHGVWSNEPVPLFPYPGSPEYTLRWGTPDDAAWERAHAHYLAAASGFSDVQDARPLALAQLEAEGAR